MDCVAKKFAGKFTLCLFGVALLAACASTERVPPVATAEHPCPAWVEFPLNRHSNADSIHLGCSNAVNLKAMLDNPEDLVRGRDLGPANGARAAIGVEKYERGQANPTQSGGQAAPSLVLSGVAGGGTQ